MRVNLEELIIELLVNRFIKSFPWLLHEGAVCM